MFSILIPLYNKEHTLKDTIDSVLSQTFKNFEVIIINDGSTDASLSVVNSYEDKRIKVINQPNSGVSKSRNVGIANARFHWIAFLDADDFKSPDWLQKIYEAIERFPEKKIFSTGFVFKFENGIERYASKFLPKIEETSIIDYMDCLGVGEPPINSSNSVFHNTIFAGTTFRVGQKNLEDLDLWARIYKPNSIVFINEILLTISRNVSSSARSNKISLDDIESYMNSLKNVAKKFPQKRKAIYKLINIYFIWLFKISYQNYNMIEKMQFILLIIRNIRLFAYF